MIYFVRGDISLAEARQSGRLEAIGPGKALRALGRWLNLSPLASIRSQRADAVGIPLGCPARSSAPSAS